MMSGMTFFDRDENPPAGGADFSIGGQGPFNCCAIVAYLDNFRREEDQTAGRRWPQQLDRILGGDCARRMIVTRALHQMVRGSPVAMAIQQRTDDAAIQYSVERFIFFLRLPLGDHFAARSRFIGVLWKTADM